MEYRPRKVSHWYKFAVCVKCEHRIDYPNHSGGLCEHCGHNSNCTICETNTVILRKTKYGPWWKFWDKLPPTYEGKDDYSKKWLGEIK